MKCGVRDMRTLRDLNTGETAVVKKICSRGSIRRRLLDLGLTENTKITCVGKSPFGDPAAYLIRGAVIAIRMADGELIRLWE